MFLDKRRDVKISLPDAETDQAKWNLIWSKWNKKRKQKTQINRPKNLIV